MRFLERFAPTFYALLRIVAGSMFSLHGAQKLFGAFGAEPQSEPLMVVAGIIELAGGLLIMVGLFTRPAAFIASGEMAVAYFMVHAPQSPWPVVNKGELAALFCFVFLYLSAIGSGGWSLEQAMGRRPTPVAGPA